MAEIEVKIPAVRMADDLHPARRMRAIIGSGDVTKVRVVVWRCVFITFFGVHGETASERFFSAKEGFHSRSRERAAFTPQSEIRRPHLQTVVEKSAYRRSVRYRAMRDFNQSHSRTALRITEPHRPAKTALHNHSMWAACEPGGVPTDSATCRNRLKNISAACKLGRQISDYWITAPLSQVRLRCQNNSTANTNDSL